MTPICSYKFQASIDNIITKILCQEFPSDYVMIISQPEDVHCTVVAGKIIVKSDISEPRYTSEALFREDIFMQVAELITKNITINKTLFLYLSLRDYGAGTAMDLIDVLENIFNNLLTIY
ncbi:hypothetical protein ILUMI_10094 [Ignelater luminosus]|uniref:Proteasome assembly chaperone 3 n=1 Tax=Ignelater luminosus TaxID=2038154 RepID=A0A8K0CYI1_IGNLU|nr:hypothetical protein ILUMI_10094 [Ignelater luminosus]